MNQLSEPLFWSCCYCLVVQWALGAAAVGVLRLLMRSAEAGEPPAPPQLSPSAAQCDPFAEFLQQCGFESSCRPNEDMPPARAVIIVLETARAARSLRAL